jgi:hypothetical protein
MIHLASATSLSWYWLWHPLSGPGYQWWSGLGSDLGQVTLIGLLIGAWRQVNCASSWCFRLGKHATADGHHKLCRRHHPDLPNHRLSLSEIHERHHQAQGEAVTDPVPNAYCIIHGTPGTDPLTIEGPFATEELATENLVADQAAHPEIPAMVDILVNPANC